MGNFWESKRSLKSRSDTNDLSKIAIVKTMKLRNTAGKKITTVTGINRKLFIGQETINYLKNPNGINENSYMLPHI